MQSVITLDMINAFAVAHEISLEDGSQYPGVIGSLLTIEQGGGTLQDKLGELVQSEEHKETFAPLVKAHQDAIAARQAAASQEQESHSTEGQEQAADEAKEEEAKSEEAAA